MKHASINSENMLDVKLLIASLNQKFSISLEQELDNALIGNNPYSFEGNAKLDATVCYNGSDIELVGSITVPMKFLCSRCGAPFKQNLFIEVGETIKDNVNDGEHFVANCDLINFGDIIRQLVALNMPSSVLCKEDCKGICPVCGKNKNEDNCSCQAFGGANNPFSCLKDKFN